MKIGLLGGTFDPPHFGHLRLAAAARRALGLDEVWLVPAGQPWRKRGRPVAAPEHRLRMARLAGRGRACLRVWDTEVRRVGPTYTADTLAELRALRPDAEICFIMGEDALADVSNWYHPERIVALATLVVAHRSGLRRTAVPEGARIAWVAMRETPVSSTDVRRRLAAGEAVRGMIPAAVERYIRRHHLYGARREPLPAVAQAAP